MKCSKHKNKTKPTRPNALKNFLGKDNSIVRIKLGGVGSECRSYVLTILRNLSGNYSYSCGNYIYVKKEKFHAILKRKNYDLSMFKSGEIKELYKDSKEFNTNASFVTREKIKENKKFVKKVEHNCNKLRNYLLAKKSRCESHFEEMLIDAKIFFIREKVNYDHVDNWCYTDFYIPYYKIAIELDGKEHNEKERKEKDIKKEEFLRKKRDITTIRYTNEECFAMKSISMNDILAKANINMCSFKKNEKITRENELKELSKKCDFDVFSDFWLYDKNTEIKYHFDNLYELKHTTGSGYKFIINAYKNNENVLVSSLYIITNSEEELDKKIEEYNILSWTPQIPKEEIYI